MASYVVHPAKSQEKIIKAFFEALEIPFEEQDEEMLPAHVLDGIAKGQADILAGRTISLDEFKKRLSSAK
ncbi:hypothetical protein [Mucilaginibacter sp. OK283]|jgi:hypothetical protein|uniref:hypothetical protein n=1 Tax=Mucilaginibacter sp. OK283 TaxID=1881049 RepID=UPI0008B16D72|nr:hypothetical protein [Mucilaginibacter sp. OK283]SEO65373.1 hypothetical protein SAMN05428947_103281 [Mucilaginibacter sp. OK283]